jgi:hypothetical protein
MTRYTRTLLSILYCVLLTLLLSSAEAQGLDPTLDQDVFNLTTAGGTFSLTGSVFSDYNVGDPPVYVTGLDYIEIPGPGLPDIFDQVVLSDNELPFIIDTINNPLGSGLSTGFTFDTFTLNTSSITDPSTLIGEYDFTLSLVDSNGNEGTGAAFAINIAAPTSSSMPEIVSPWSLGGLLIAGCLILGRRRAVGKKG